jgi:hypothetical protein
MPGLLRDDSRAVRMVAVSSLGEHPGDAPISLLASRLGELHEEADVALARDIIGVLAASPSPVVEQALRQATEKGKTFGRGRHPEIRRMAAEALARRMKAGAG